MTELVEFIRARIAEDRALAKACGQPWAAQWIASLVGGRVRTADSRDARIAESTLTSAKHIAQQDPAATLARCDALAALVGLHGPVPRDDGAPWCMNDGHDFPCPTLRTLAAIWSSHSDYRQERSA